MATTNLGADSARVTQIADCLKHAHELESIIAEVGAALYAIAAGDLFAALPEAGEDQHRHNQGSWLLSLAEQRLASTKGFGDELSAKLSRLLSDIEREAA